MLRVEDVTVHFGGVRALEAVGIEVAGAAVTGLIGPNGAGKTTLFNVISGLQRPNGGRVLLDGRDVTRLAPRRRAHRGLARTFQRLETFGSMSVRDNIQVAAELHRGVVGRRGRDPRTVTDEILHRLHLEPVASAQSDTLPTGLARLVELGRALATEPKVLLLDEPSSGLNSAETDTVGDLLVELAESGIAVLLVEHDVELVMRVCRHVWVLDFGRIIANGSPAAVQADPAVRLAYLGAEAHTEEAEPQGERPAGAMSVRVADAAGGNGAGTVPSEQATASTGQDDGTTRAAPPALELRGVHAGYGTINVLHGVDLTVPTAAVYALLGPNGAGKSTTLKVASGRLHPVKGTVYRDGQNISTRRPERLARVGLCTIPEGRGVFPNLTVSENLQMWSFRGGVSRRDIEERSYDRFPILAQRRKQLAGTLSGGEQQMLAMSRALSTDPSLLLLDEISMGLAPLVVAELYELVAHLAQEGITILLVEQSARTALDVATHAAVMTNGRIELAGTPREVADAVLDVYLGAGSAAPQDVSGAHGEPGAVS